MSYKCEMVGCGEYADWLVMRPGATRSSLHGRAHLIANQKNVCLKCRDELIGAYGWHLIWNRGHLPDSQPDPENIDRAATRTRSNLERMLSELPEDDPSYHRGLSQGTV